MPAFLFENLGISVLDIILAVVILASLFAGIMKGIIKSIAWLPGLILGYFAVYFFNKPLASLFIENSILPPLWSSVVSVIILMGGTYLVVRLLASIFASFLEEVGLNALDRALGGLFSLCLVLIVIGLICAVIDNFSFFEGLQRHLDASWLVVHVIRPFYAGTLSMVKEAF